MRNVAPNKLVDILAETERNPASNSKTQEQEGSSLENDQLSKDMDVDVLAELKDNMMIVQELKNKEKDLQEKMNILESWKQIKTLAYQVQQASTYLKMANIQSSSEQPSSTASITTENIH